MTGEFATIGMTSVVRRTAEVARALGVDPSPSPLAVLDDARIARVAVSIAERASADTFERATWDNRLFWNAEADAPQRSQYFAIGNAINFRFWQFEGRRVV